MREKRSALVIKKEHIRITPASAGKTLEKEEKNQRVREKPKVTSSTFLKQQDYPRVCGKNMSEVSKELPPAGSPPRVREKLTSDYKALSRIRITPASAGKTPTSASGISSTKDHPRECGKNHVFLIAVLQISGSPPRVREKL